MPDAAITETTGGRLAQVVQRFAERTALIERGRHLSFGGLDAAADAISGSLAANGVREGQRVALLFRNRVPAIASMFGAARAGSVYVPLDAGDPEQRLRGILEDCDPAALLTEASLTEHARVIAPHGCVVIDAAEAIEHAPPPTPPRVGANDPLYLYYTSGSTGRPKGAAQTHRNLLFFADAYARGLAISARDRHSLVYSLSFNAANMDIYGALLAGATLAVRDLRSEGHDGTAEWLDRERITILHTVPTVFRELCTRVPHARVFPHLRVIDLGGEAVFANDVKLFRAHTAGSCVLVNQLASTEVGLIAQHRIGHAGPGCEAAIVPVGSCPEGVRVEIVGDDGSPAAPGEPGEMVVCSEHVCPGYWRRPELDVQVFAPDPSLPGQRRYRSGDLGFVDADGNLNFLGRRGNRVKVRGHSVDLAEIDAALAACPGIARGAVVVADSDHAPDAVRLVACVSMQPGMRGDPQWLRRELSRSLPSYMLPGTLAFVDAMPVTASGKIDRQSLATKVLALPEVATPERAADPPHDEYERTVAQTFEQLLHVAPVGREDDFYLLGGDSLLASELQLLLRDRFGVHVGTLHEEATVVGIATALRTARGSGNGSPQALPVLVPLWREGSQVPLFLVHGRNGQAFVSPHFMRLLGDDQPVHAFQARGLDGLAAPHASVEAMAEEYLAALRSQRPHGPYFIGALCAGAYVAAVMARLLAAAGEVVLPLLLLDPTEDIRASAYTGLSEEHFAARMAARRALGRNPGLADDPAYQRSVWAVAQAFDAALIAHHPQPYAGPAYMLSSRQRIRSGQTDTLHRAFAGRIRRFEVGATHRDALDPRNPAFASYLARCLGLIRGAVPASPRFASSVPQAGFRR
ncbi:MAG: AMP-binding protein [Casimicrobiaceae bacterium]